MQISFEKAVEENKKSEEVVLMKNIAAVERKTDPTVEKVFNFKEFTKWWENYKKNKYEAEKRIEDVLREDKTTYLKTEIMIEDFRRSALQN